MKFKKIYGILLFTIIMSLNLIVVKAETIHTSNNLTPDGYIGTHMGNNYWHLTATKNNAIVDVFCLNRGLDYTGDVDYTYTRTYNQITGDYPYVCAIVKVARENNGSIPYNAMQEAMWDAEEAMKQGTGAAYCSSYQFTQAKAAYCDNVREKNTYNTTEVLKTEGTNPTLTANKTSDTMTTTSDKTHYVSSKISITSDGSFTLDISDLPEDSFISKNANCTGNHVALNASEKDFYVCIPTTADIDPNKRQYTIKASRKVNVTDTYEYYHVTEYYDQTCYKAKTAERASFEEYGRSGSGPNGLTNQNLALVGYTPSTGGDSYTKSVDDKRDPKTTTKIREAEAKVTIAFTLPVKAKLSKKDITNEKELPGAHIVITDSDDNVLFEYDSTETPYEFYLMPGEYKLKETAAPEGYNPIETVFEFKVLANRTVQLIGEENNTLKANEDELTLYNTPVPEVPETGKTTNFMLPLTGGVILLAGVGMLLIILKEKKIS